MATSTIKNIATSGGANYCKLPDGTLLMYGNESFAVNQWVAWKAFANLPATPVGDYTIVATSSNGSSFASVAARSDGFQLQVSFVDNVQEVRWLIIGRWK